MEPYEEQDFPEKKADEMAMPANRRMLIGLVVLLGLAGIASSYAMHERSQVVQLTEQATTAKNSMTQLQNQVNTLTARLNDMTIAQAANTVVKRPNAAAPASDDSDVTPPAIATSLAPSSSIVPATKPAPPKRATTKKRVVVDKRYSQLKAQLDDQQKQLKDTQDQVARNRAELEGSISSTRDELNGSIARTHDELVALEKRGERNYTEFDLTKSKQFQRIGPISLSLRKADTKHKSYDLTMLVDDNELSKKKVNLYEPVWIHNENGGQAVQVVVNRIGKDSVHGYVSAPKYKESELPTLSSSSAPSGAAAGPTTQRAAQQ